MFLLVLPKNYLSKTKKMKKLFGILAITALMASCGDGETTTTETTTDSTKMSNDAMTTDTSMNRMDTTMTDTPSR